MWKKYFQRILCLSILFALFACSSEGDTEDRKKTPEGELAYLQMLLSITPDDDPCTLAALYERISRLPLEKGWDGADSRAEQYRGKCDRCEQRGRWGSGNFVNQFDEVTNVQFVALSELGTFSNTATGGDKLRATIYTPKEGPDDPEVYFEFREYDDNPLSKLGESFKNGIQCELKGTRTGQFQIRLQQEEGDNFFTIDEFDHASSKENFSRALQSGDQLKFSCYQERSETTKYKFQLNLAGFESAKQCTQIWRPTLIHVWATWSLSSREDHANAMAMHDAGWAVHGLNYKDKPERATEWLKTLGNPYERVIADPEGYIGDNLVFGLTVPSTLIVGRNGSIAYRHTGVMNGSLYRNMEQEFSRTSWGFAEPLRLELPQE
jgi:hypothetical protein